VIAPSVPELYQPVDQSRGHRGQLRPDVRLLHRAAAASETLAEQEPQARRGAGAGVDESQLTAADSRQRQTGGVPSRATPPQRPAPARPAASRWVLHVDLDEFIAAVEVLRRPDLAGRPVVVGGTGDLAARAVVSTASYAAREFGIRSGMPLRAAAKRCPSAVFLPVDKPAYEAASEQVMAALRQFEAVVEVIGWDEAFLGAVTTDPEELARRIAAQVLTATGLNCSVGIGQNKLQAKLATGFGKPAGVFRITSATWFSLLGDRPPDALQGIGARTAKKLAEMGISTVSELAATDDAALAARFGPAIGPWLGQTGRGRDPSPVAGDPRVARSRSREVTFQQNLDDWEQVRSEVARLAALVQEDVAPDGRLIGRVGLKLRWAPFTTQTRAKALSSPTLDAGRLEQAVLAALDSFPPGPDGTRRAVRLAGVRYEFA
jgi:nucleotidyltransferase/DNA polymerase involved in DNA repair